MAYLNHWTTLCVFMIWLPLMIMLTSFVFIYQKLSKSIKAFPYLSVQSKVARSRKKVIGMLLILIVIEIICWAPWMLWITFQYINFVKSEKSKVKNQKVIIKSLKKRVFVSVHVVLEPTYYTCYHST